MLKMTAKSLDDVSLRERELESLFSSSSAWGLSDAFTQHKTTESGYGVLGEDSAYSDDEEEEDDQQHQEEEGWGSSTDSDANTSETNKRKRNRRTACDEDEERQRAKKQPAWVDDDDENEPASSRSNHKLLLNRVGQVAYHEVVRDKFTSAMGPAPAWATQAPRAPNKPEDSDAIGRMEFLACKSATLSPEVLSHSWMLDINIDARSVWRESHIMDSRARRQQKVFGSNVLFARTHAVALVTHRQKGEKGDGHIQVFQVGERRCFKLDEVLFRRFPVSAAAFLPDERSFVVGSKEAGKLYVYDMQAAAEIKINWKRNGQPRFCQKMCLASDNTLVIQEKAELTLVDLRTWRPTGTLRASNGPTTFHCSFSGDTLYTHSRDGSVVIWDLRTNKSRAKFLDDGCIKGTAITCSPNSHYLATGNNCGIVNVYDARGVEAAARSGGVVTPVKVFDHLVTPVHCLEFNYTSEILLMSSPHLPAAIKLAQFPSMTVFSNFPGSRPSTENLSSVTFSPNSGYMAMCNNAGRVMRVRLQYYENY